MIAEHLKQSEQMNGAGSSMCANVRTASRRNERGARVSANISLNGAMDSINPSCF